ncbi:MAG: hypothetical protein QG574_4211 [Cyanobacteriota bacterium erpe_2018_sw_21hr_WHONDRS-SW48-000092_B_bin.40]|jgi:hypothetical protein|nr:hypothetical protein [Cyanobacteriota bacterium erpe_2018_sw_21hr_WHONDRS-SW48-000092_B_bin.40]
MSKSWNGWNIVVNEENYKKPPAFNLDLKEINLEAVIKMGLKDIMFPFELTQQWCHL